MVGVGSLKSVPGKFPLPRTDGGAEEIESLPKSTLVALLSGTSLEANSGPSDLTPRHASWNQAAQDRSALFHWPAYDLMSTAVSTIC